MCRDIVHLVEGWSWAWAHGAAPGRRGPSPRSHTGRRGGATGDGAARPSRGPLAAESDATRDARPSRDACGRRARSRRTSTAIRPASSNATHPAADRGPTRAPAPPAVITDPGAGLVGTSSLNVSQDPTLSRFTGAPDPRPVAAAARKYQECR
jgi:hypothetical protein